MSEIKSEEMHQVGKRGSEDGNSQESSSQHRPGGSERWGDQEWGSRGASSSGPTPVPPPRRPRPPVAGPARSAPVQVFLRSLQPSMEQHLPLFLDWGIQDEPSLLCFKQWSPEKQNQFLSEKLNKFQILKRLTCSIDICIYFGFDHLYNFK